MTIITSSSRRSFVLATDHTNQLAEELGFNLEGLEFVEGAQEGDMLRGYVKRLLVGVTMHNWGPIKLYPEDLAIYAKGNLVES